MELRSMDEFSAAPTQEEQELAAQLKDTSAEVLEVSRGFFNGDAGWRSHFATVLVHVGPLSFKLKIKCFDEGRFFECLWCSDPQVMRILESETKLQCLENTMHDLLRHIMFEKLREAIVQTTGLDQG